MTDSHDLAAPLRAGSRPSRPGSAVWLLLGLAAACAPAPRPAPAPPPAPPPAEPVEAPAAVPVFEPPPPAPREFRGAWVASVANIDWPSRPGLAPEAQRRELLAILDRAVELRLNAVILQVRPAADALYASPHEPWSEYLTGRMGQAPEPFYDPLEFAVAEAHRRGLELHAWFNPFRARQAGARSPVSPEHISRTRPELVRTYGRYLWLDPGEPDVQEHSIRVILDVVRRYDIDGVHIDDYFYPYRVRDARGREVAFPDERSWTAYRRAGGTLSRDDWRRDNVDRFVERLYRELRAAKPWVRLGISPFGIWRPGHPDQIRGLDAYDHIYADSRKWLLNGWLDYFTPQLYWPVAQTAQSYPVLLDWWVTQNRYGRHIWPGNFTSRAIEGGERSWPAAEIVEQVRLTRDHPGAGGNVHFSMRSLMPANGSVGEALRAGTYLQPALVPATPWLDSVPPPAPSVVGRLADGDAFEITLEPGSEKPVWRWIVQTRSGGAWSTELLPGHVRRHPLAGAGRLERVVVTAVDRVGNESPPVLVPLGEL